MHALLISLCLRDCRFPLRKSAFDRGVAVSFGCRDISIAADARETSEAAVSQEKAEYAYSHALSGMDKMRRAGVKVGFGTDLLGKTYVQECREFTIRREVFSPLELLRQATSTNAELMLQQGKLGCIAPGAHADLLVVDGDPLKDISLLAANGAKLSMIVRAGAVVKDELR